MSEDIFGKSLMGGKPRDLAARIARIDDQAGALVAALGEYEREFDDAHKEQGWDWPLLMVMIHRSLPPPELADKLRTDVGAQAFMIGMKFIDLTEVGVNVEGGPDLAYFLSWLAKQMTTDAEAGESAMVTDLRSGAPDLLAWGLHLEGYEVSGGPGMPLPTGEFKNDPRSLECRLIMAVDRAGYRYSIRRLRTADEVSATVDLDPSGKSLQRLGGPVLDSLSAVMEATPAGAP